MNPLVPAALVTFVLPLAAVAPRPGLADAGYTVQGQHYHILDSAEGFSERGTASWYGSRFHGRATASGEPFDVHALTAAHPHLPLQSVVRVSDVGTGASVVVRINDRGPFADERVIDLSRAAARELGMLERGTAEVTIEALDARPASETPDGGTSTGEEAPSDGTTAGEGDADRAFVQLGAFAERANADALLRRTRARSSLPVGIEHDAGRALYRVRVGPIDEGPALRRALDELSKAGIDGHIVRVPPR